jgi:hypothetical protein
MIGHELNNLANQSDYIVQVYKNKLKPGDLIIIRTINSTYSIKVADDGSYIVSGGWFDKKNLSPSKIKINGCTWGGSIIKSDIIAACGLKLEFQNRVVTSSIKKIFYIPYCCGN